MFHELCLEFCLLFVLPLKTRKASLDFSKVPLYSDLFANYFLIVTKSPFLTNSYAIVEFDDKEITT